MIDITKLLKDCPKGTKLYSPLFGEVKLDDAGGILCKQCIPFEGNERLVRTDEPCPEEFINW